ncbi:sigma-70 family RNA polymerase sigma factor [Actinomadura fulvescens]|uniref:Sigma-70 family RNA polymerase sigma factor n=1 Tax=Actinomadura fulvescens TaxID=46160 RepID=A0ABP6C3D0_9ACTN
MNEAELLEAGRRGDEDAFGRLVAPYRSELHAHCYRMLGSIHDADDALQDALFGAWRGLANFEGRSSLRTWLYRITTNACLRFQAKRPRRVLSADYGPAIPPDGDLGEPVTGPVWLEAYPDDELSSAAPEARYELRESVELAFVAALQHLPANQRAVLILREVLGFSAAEVAGSLGTSVASVNSALQRARRTVHERVPARTQQATLRALGDEAERAFVDAIVAAWERADVDTVLGMLARDVRFTMPPLPAWFDGRDDVGVFLRERVFATPWRMAPTRANGQLALLCYQGDGNGGFDLAALNVLTLDEHTRITEITAFCDPAVVARFGRAQGSGGPR